MQITTGEQRRVLEYIRMLNVGGYRPLGREVEEWRARPNRLPGAKGKMISPGTRGTPPAYLRDLADFARSMDAFGQSVSQQFFKTNSFADAILGTSGTPAVYAPDGPPESFIDHLVRLSWVLRDTSGRLALTDLSRALLRAEAAEDDDRSGAIVLDPDDPAAWAKVVGHVADAGEAMVVDPYLRVEQFTTLLTHTEARRFLVGPNLSPSQKAVLAVVADDGDWDPAPDVREAGFGEIHDRFIVSATSVSTLGTSLNAVGRKTSTVLMPLPGVAAEHIRIRMEETWSTATPLAVDRPPETA